MTYEEFSEADAFARAGYDDETAKAMREIQNRTGMSATAIIALYELYGIEEVFIPGRSENGG